MSTTTAARLAWSVAGLTGVVLVCGLILRPSLADAGWLVAIGVPFVPVGALLASRRPGNPIGWLFLVFGAVATLDFALYQYVHRAFVGSPGSLPAPDVAATLATHVWHPSFGLLVFSFLLFPEGRLLSPRWRWVAGVTLVTYAGLAISGIFDTQVLEDPAPYFRRARPLVDGPVASVGSAVFGFLLFVNLALLVVAGASLVLRLRRSSGVERRQVKWFVATVALVMFAFPVLLFAAGSAYGVLLFPLIPISAAVAILRHRLWDIDVVVRRTLVYGVLTATLAVAYLACVLVLELALDPVTRTSDLAVAGSTLAVAALFGPARARIQRLVDRRFFRRRYDAQRTLEGFSARLRDELDLDALSAELRRVVDDAVRPAHVSLWLRGGEGRR